MEGKPQPLTPPLWTSRANPWGQLSARLPGSSGKGKLQPAPGRREYKQGCCVISNIEAAKLVHPTVALCRLAVTPSVLFSLSSSHLDLVKAAALEVRESGGDEILMEKRPVLPVPRRWLASRASTLAEDRPQQPRASWNRSQQHCTAWPGMLFPLHHPQFYQPSDGKWEINQPKKYYSNHLPHQLHCKPIKQVSWSTGEVTWWAHRMPTIWARLTHFIGFKQAMHAVCCLQHTYSVYQVFRLM